MHKAVFMAQLHDVGGGSRDVAGRGEPRGNTIGWVRRTWAGGICGDGLKRRCPFVSKKSKKTQLPPICVEVQLCLFDGIT